MQSAQKLAVGGGQRVAGSGAKPVFMQITVTSVKSIHERLNMSMIQGKMPVVLLYKTRNIELGVCISVRCV